VSDLNRVILDGTEYGVREAMAGEVAASVRAAMESGLVVTLDLLDAAGREVTVFFNGGAAATAAFDFGTVPRPTEISG